MHISRRAFCVGLSAVPLMSQSQVGSVKGKVKIGVLSDFSSIYASVMGKGSVLAATLAIEDFKKANAGMDIELVSADHQNKPDIGSTMARKWYDEEGVGVIVDIGASAVALAVQGVAKEKNKIVMITGSSSQIHGKYCGRNSFHWSYDSYMQSAGVAAALVKEGKKSWYFVTADWAFGHALEADARKKILELGGRVVGEVKTPVNTLDYSSHILQAQASGANAIGIALAGDDLERFIRQGAEYNLWKGRSAAAFALQLFNVPAIGTSVLTGVQHNSSFVWDRNQQTRAFSKRFFDQLGKPPSEVQALCYSEVLSYLKAVKAAGTQDTDAVIKSINTLPVDDAVSGKGYVRKDGRLIRPTWLVEVKAEADVKEKWDFFKIIREIPGEESFGLPSGECSMMKA